MPVKRTTICLPPELIAEAQQYGINLSKAATNGIEAAIEREKKIKELGL